MHNIELTVQHTPHRQEGIAATELLENGSRLCELDIQYSQLREFRTRDSHYLDFLVLASAVYALDKTIPRGSTEDGWTRAIGLSLPVSDSPRWNLAAAQLTQALNFLTGDRWQFTFTRLSHPIVFPRPVSTWRLRSAGLSMRSTDAVCLFSGGLDSLVGVIDHLEQSTSRLLLVGHHDGDIAGPFSDQRRLIAPLRAAYPRRLRPIFARVGQDPAGPEITLRSRSLLFIALGLYGAGAVGADVRLLIPENGTIALNFPLTPSRRGSCSTRTAHPHYLNALGRALHQLGISNPFLNPLASKTKGEVVRHCANPELLLQLAPMAVSCAKRSRRMYWKRRTARSCGQCMPCIYRRAALHQLQADTEVYGNDVCNGEVDVFGDDDSGRDFRACLSLLQRDPSPQEVANTLLASGPLRVAVLPEHAALVLRPMDEIRELLRDKGRPDVRRAAGLPG